MGFNCLKAGAILLSKIAWHLEKPYVCALKSLKSKDGLKSTYTDPTILSHE